MPNDLIKIELLSEEEAGVEPISKEALPGAIEPKKEPEPQETPEQKVEREKLEKEAKEKNLSNPAILSAEEAEIELKDKGKPKPFSKKEIDSVLDYKALAEAKVENGDWDKWDNWDEVKDTVDWTPELYLQLEKEQFDTKVQKTVDEEKAALPKRIQEITEYIKNGGKEEDLYSSYQQQVDIESLDPSNPEDAENIIEAHCEAMEWTEKRTKSYIESLKDKGVDELKSTAEESKGALVKIVQEERAESLQAQAVQAEQQKLYFETFNRKVREAIYKENDVPEREKKDLEKFVYDYKHIDKNTGNKYSDFGAKWQEISQDPNKYYKFVKFIKDFDKFEDKTKTEKETKKNLFNFLREGQKDLGKNLSSQSPELQKDNKRQKGQYNPFASLSGV